MEAKQNGDMGYIEKAFVAYGEIMSSCNRGMLENINRASKGELFVLHYLSERNAQVLPSELSAALNASTGRISALLSNLEKKGQIEREIDKTNRRNILVTVTEEGHKRAETEMKEIRKKITHVFTEMGEADTTEFIKLTKEFWGLMQKHMSQSHDGTGRTDGG